MLVILVFNMVNTRTRMLSFIVVIRVSEKWKCIGDTCI